MSLNVRQEFLAADQASQSDASLCQPFLTLSAANVYNAPDMNNLPADLKILSWHSLNAQIIKFLSHCILLQEQSATWGAEQNPTRVS